MPLLKGWDTSTKLNHATARIPRRITEIGVRHDREGYEDPGEEVRRGEVEMPGVWERIKVGDEVPSKHAIRGRYKIYHKECYKALIVK